MNLNLYSWAFGKGGEIMPLNVTPLYFWSQQVLPFVYDDSLSYLEQVYKVSEKLNEVISATSTALDETKEYVDNQDNATNASLDEVDQREQQHYNELKQDVANAITTSKAYTDERYGALAAAFDEKLNTGFAGIKAELFEELSEQLNIPLDELKEQFVALQVLVSQQYEQLVKMIRDGDAATQSYCMALIAELEAKIPEITSVQVVDPTTGQITDIQTALDRVFYVLRCCSLTAGEYDRLYLTAADYDREKLTALQYDIQARHFLYPYFQVWKMSSPFTGEFVNVRQVVGDLTELHRTSGITARQYDDYDLTATEYDNLHLTAYVYSWDFPTLPACRI